MYPREIIADMFYIRCEWFSIIYHIYTMNKSFLTSVWSACVTIYFSFQPVLHDWCNKGCGMYYPVCGMMHIKKTLLLIRKSSPCGGSRFPLSLSEWSFTICPTPYNHKIKCVSASLNKTFPFFPLLSLYLIAIYFYRYVIFSITLYRERVVAQW